ncbi:MAG: hypothetical protein JO086_10900 [Acidimicrobiia bacterium]|nr:hypothetical protein [Acidimicrobiia bacterium]
MNRKALAVLCSSAMAVSGMFLLTGANSPSKAAVGGAFANPNNWTGYASGTAVHVDALHNLVGPTSELADVSLGFGSAASNSTGLLGTYVPALPSTASHPATLALKGKANPNGAGINNEMGLPIIANQMKSFGDTALDNFGAGGRADGLDLGLGTDPVLNQAQAAGLAEQAADPKTPGGDTAPDNSITRNAAVPGDPLLFASLLKGNAAANFSTACDTNLPIDPGSSGVVHNPAQAGLQDSRPDLGWGLGNVAQAELLNLAAGLPPAVGPILGAPNSQALLAVENQQGNNTNQAAAEARSVVHLDGPPGGPFSLVTETHEVIAPITIAKGTPNAVTITIIGDPVLKAIATGNGLATPVTSATQYPQAQAGNTRLEYTPPSLIEVTQGGTTQTFPFPGNGGQIPPIAVPGGPVINISLGESARAPDQAIPGNSDATTPVGPISVHDATGDTIWGALDVARVTVLIPGVTQHVAELRVGHMEAEAHVPAAGITCPAAATTSTNPGGSSSTTVTPSTQPQNTTTTTPGATTTTTPGATTTTTPGATTTTAAPNNNSTATTLPPQVAATTFSQTPAATPQSVTPNFTG